MYSASNLDTKGTCTIPPLLHSVQCNNKCWETDPSEPVTRRKLESWFKVMMPLSLSCNMLYGKEKVDYSLLLWCRTRGCSFSSFNWTKHNHPQMPNGLSSFPFVHFPPLGFGPLVRESQRFEAINTKLCKHMVRIDWISSFMIFSKMKYLFINTSIIKKQCCVLHTGLITWWDFTNDFYTARVLDWSSEEVFQPQSGQMLRSDFL